MKTVIHFKNGEEVELPGVYAFPDECYNRLTSMKYEENGEIHKIAFWIENVLYIESVMQSTSD